MNELEKLQEIATNIAQRARSLLESMHSIRRESSTKLHLAHYTSLEAIVSMLQVPGGGLRLSGSDTMNDPDEGCATEDARIISDLLKNKFGTESYVWKRYSSAHLCCLIGIDQPINPDIGIGDNLLFWRLYGNECRGVSITIPPHRANELVESSVVQRVVYTEEPDVQIDEADISQLLIDLNELHSQASKANLWPEICQEVIRECDLLLGQRFLLKRSHYKMEREYRAVTFVTQGSDNAPEDSQFVSRGQHVQFGYIRTYVQIRELLCESILTTGSRITIGKNVHDAHNARDTVESLVEERLNKAPNVVITRVSKISYRSG